MTKSAPKNDAFQSVGSSNTSSRVSQGAKESHLWFEKDLAPELMPVFRPQRRNSTEEVET